MSSSYDSSSLSSESDSDQSHSPSRRRREGSSQSSSDHRRRGSPKGRKSSNHHRIRSRERNRSTVHHRRRSREGSESPANIRRRSRERSKSPRNNRRRSRERSESSAHHRRRSRERSKSPVHRRRRSQERSKFTSVHHRRSRERSKSPDHQRIRSLERRKDLDCRRTSRDRSEPYSRKRETHEREKPPGRRTSRERRRSPCNRTSRERRSPGRSRTLHDRKSCDKRESCEKPASRDINGRDVRHSRSHDQVTCESGRHSEKTQRPDDGGKHQKRHRKRRNRSSSSSSDSSSSSSSKASDSGKTRSPSPSALLARLQAEREKKLQERRQQKELMKSLETPEQKRARRLRKKIEKEKWRKQKLGWDQEYLHYTNEDNPFGDANLLDTFRWDKKLVKEGLHDIDDDQLSKLNRAKMQENKRELEKVKARRLQREQELEEREREMTLQRSRQEAEQFRAWEKQEDQFHLRQCTLRSKIRIQEGRAKPIDLLAQYIGCSQDESDQVLVHEPFHYLLGLSCSDLDDLITDIGVYQRLELQPEQQRYWNDITIVVQHELEQLQQRNQLHSGQDAEGGRNQMHSDVTVEIEAILHGKTAEQLTAMQEQIQNKLKSSLDGVDVSYWERLLSKLKAHAARARLRDQHQIHLREKLRLLKESQGVRDESSEMVHSPQNTDNRVVPSDDKEADNEPDPPDPEVDAPDAQAPGAASEPGSGEDLLDCALRDYRGGCYTPPLIDPADLEEGTLLTDPADDTHRLDDSRQTVLERGGVVESALTSEEKALQREASRGMEGDEAKFSVEADIGPQHHLWSDKYRPRKPRYFNRVHTGFDWNKYNQTHYDMDNPPPKVVQGYKFNIFYPDLIDRSATPEYTLTVCEDKKEFCILRFRAGPPYQDIAFTIVNREWEYSYRHGFRCQFHNNVFQLWFHFKRYRYRR